MRRARAGAPLPNPNPNEFPTGAAVWRGLATEEYCNATVSRKGARSRPAVPRAGIPGDVRAQEGHVRMRRRRRQGRRAGRFHQDLGLPREEPRPRGAGGQSGQGLPAARRGVRRRRLREDDELRARLAGLRRLLSLASVAPLQGAVQRGLLLDDGRRGGVRRPQQHGRRPRQHLLALRPEDDRGVDHLHGGSHRRRPAFLHRDRQGQGLGPEGIRRSLRPHAGLRRQPRRRLRRHDQGHSRELLEGRRARSRTTRSTSSRASTASASATIAN